MRAPVVVALGASLLATLALFSGLGTATRPAASEGVLISAVAAGADHSCALTSAGGVKCWGYNGAGRLGDGTTTNSPTPVDVVGLGGKVVALTAGDAHTCALIEGGIVECWGRNEQGQLGNGTASGYTTPNAAPVEVVDLTDVTAVSAGGEHTCAMRSAGAAMCWGQNTYGELGAETSQLCGGSPPQPCSTRPVNVSGLETGVLAVVAGGAHSCAVTEGGRLKCWGSNTHGQLGASTTELCSSSPGNYHSCSSVPIDVFGLDSGVASVDLEYWHTCAVTTAGGVKCWGWGVYGAIGDGTTTDLTCPPKTVPRKMTVLRVVEGGLDAQEQVHRRTNRGGAQGA